MALKRKHKEVVDDINFKMAVVAEKGMPVIYDTANAGFVKKSGATLTVKDKCAGILMIDVVNKDFGAVPQNFQKLETGLSGYVRLAKLGELSTDNLAAGAQFGAGSGVYLDINSTLRDKPVSGFADDPAGLRLGTALGAVDADGFLEVYFDIG